MRNMLTELQRRIDLANTRRSLDDQLRPMVHAICRSTRPDGGPDFINRATVLSIGEDYLELEGHGMIDRLELRNVQPINF